MMQIERLFMRTFTVAAIKTLVIGFALLGLGLCAAFVGVNLHLTNTSGIVDRLADTFWENGKTGQAAAVLVGGDAFFNRSNYCILQKLKSTYPGTFWRVLTLAMQGKKVLAQNNLNVAVANLGIDASVCTEPMSEPTRSSFEEMAGMVDPQGVFILATSTEWAFFKAGVIKDTGVIKRVENETGIKSRLLVSIMVSEQMRLFYSDRAWFEAAIAPTKVLASMSQFSLGILGMKLETAQDIEKYAKDPTSEFYPGVKLEHSLDFTTEDIDGERFKRLTDSHDHYYNYLYAALYCKEIMAQWQKAGIDLSERPEIVATLFNIGFAHSKPNPEPKVGGAAISIGDTSMSFGGLSYNFYYSGELLNGLPQ